MYLKGIYKETLKRGSHSIDSEREDPEAVPSDYGFDPCTLYPGQILPRQRPDRGEERGSFLRRRGSIQKLGLEYHETHSDMMPMSRPDTDELNDVLDILFPPIRLWKTFIPRRPT